ncbi:MAG TPA: glucose 1-dehydrogenase [Verrucomicrobiae bacterium]|jgi:NAD(P)-dependent dehydrogenase (short-subunit alcohol dehydrogenase family)|nr:glucose 1-dehydrogenase [Verrucomicrobiae bacterium]
MNRTLENKVAVVTGGTSGIGKAAALALAKAGAKIVVAGRRENEGNAVVKDIEKAGGKALFVKTDVSREADVKALMDKAVANFGRLDIAFNNAGIEGQMGLTTDTQTFENYQSVFDINVKGVLLSMKHEAAAMLRNGGGSIVNTSSIAGQIGLAGGGVYVASKHAVNGLSKSAALEFAKKGIRVNTVSPGTIQTEMIGRMIGEGESEAKKWWQDRHPVGRFGSPEEVAAAVVWLASPEASFVTGTDIAVDGGYLAQ